MKTNENPYLTHDQNDLVAKSFKGAEATVKELAQKGFTIISVQIGEGLPTIFVGWDERLRTEYKQAIKQRCPVLYRNGLHTCETASINFCNVRWILPNPINKRVMH